MDTPYYTIFFLVLSSFHLIKCTMVTNMIYQGALYPDPNFEKNTRVLSDPDLTSEKKPDLDSTWFLPNKINLISFDIKIISFVIWILFYQSDPPRFWSINAARKVPFYMDFKPWYSHRIRPKFENRIWIRSDLISKNVSGSDQNTRIRFFNLSNDRGGGPHVPAIFYLFFYYKSLP